MDLVEWIYSDGDYMMAQCKLITMFMCLQFCLAMVSVLRDGMRSVG